MPLATHSGVGLVCRQHRLIHHHTKFPFSDPKLTSKNHLLCSTTNYIYCLLTYLSFLLNKQAFVKTLLWRKASKALRGRTCFKHFPKICLWESYGTNSNKTSSTEDTENNLSWARIWTQHSTLSSIVCWPQSGLFSDLTLTGDEDTEINLSWRRFELSTPLFQALCANLSQDYFQTSHWQV